MIYMRPDDVPFGHGSPAVLLLSGGLDSGTMLAFLKDRGWIVRCLAFDYNQRHLIELQKAKELALRYGHSFQVLKIDYGSFALRSALTDNAIEVPDLPAEEIGKSIPSTYVPGRNIAFLSIAAGYAESLHVGDIFYAANALDFSGYPDCRPDFVQAFNIMLQKGQAEPVQVHAPFIGMHKWEIALRSLALNMREDETWSCYHPVDEKPCGRCDSCKLRADAFKEARAVMESDRREVIA